MNKAEFPSKDDNKPKNIKDMSFVEQDELQTTLDTLALKNFKDAPDTSLAEIQFKNDRSEYQAEKDLSLQQISTDKQSIENLTQQAVEAAKKNIHEEYFPVQEITDAASIPVDRYETPADEEITRTIKNLPDGTEPFTDTRSDEEKQQPAKPVTGLKKLKVALAMMLGLGIGGQAIAQGGEKSVSSMKDAQEQVDLSKAVKVTTVPAEYKKFSTEGTKTYYLKKSDGLEAATSGVKGDPEKYMNNMIALVKSGTSPAELLEKHYIDEPAAKTLEQFYIPNKLDVVYTQPETVVVKENPFAAYAEMGTIYYGPNAHAAAEVRIATRNSQQIQDGGMLNTQEPPVYIQFRDDFKNIGKPFLLPAAEMQKYFAGTDRFISQDAYDTLFKRAMNEQSIGTISTKDLATK